MDRFERRKDWLDGLRLLAALAVLLQHYLERVFPQEAAWFLTLGPGVFGVVLFFFISGYVIPLSVKNGLHPFKFTLRRVFRIWPMYVVVMTVCIALGHLGFAPYEQVKSFTGSDYLANLFLSFEYVNRPAVVGVAWSLSLELIWYAVFGVYFLTTQKKNAAIATMMTACALATLSFMSMILEVRLPFGRLGMLNAAFLGYAFFSFHQKAVSGSELTRAAILFLLAIGMSQWVGFSHFSHPSVSFQNGITSWAGAFLLFTVLCISPFMQNLLIWRSGFVGALGAASYSIYLLHEPVFHIIQRQTNGLMLVILAMLTTAIFAIATHRWIERPMIRIGAELSEKSTGRALKPRPFGVSPSKFSPKVKQRDA